MKITPITLEGRVVRLERPVPEPELSRFGTVVSSTGVQAAIQVAAADVSGAVGRILAALDSTGERENTLVVFFSDNGGSTGARNDDPQYPNWTQYPPGPCGGRNEPLRGKKGQLYEGGIRVPGILRWPGKAAAGGRSDEPICGVDFLPTVCDITGIKPPRDRPLDGASFLPALEGKPIARSTPLYWHFNRAEGKPKVAMRVGELLFRMTNGPEGGACNRELGDTRHSFFKPAVMHRDERTVSEVTRLGRASTAIGARDPGTSAPSCSGSCALRA